MMLPLVLLSSPLVAPNRSLLDSGPVALVRKTFEVRPVTGPPREGAHTHPELISLFSPDDAR